MYLPSQDRFLRRAIGEGAVSNNEAMYCQHHQKRTYVRISMITCALGTQNWSSFLCHRTDNLVFLIRCGRAIGWLKKKTMSDPVSAYEFETSNLCHFSLINVQ